MALVGWTEVPPLTSQTKNRLILAFLSFTALAVAAGLTLDDWRFRATVWIVLAGLAVKTWVAAKRRDE